MADIEVEVAFGLPNKQFLKAVTVADGSSVEDAIDASGVKKDFVRRFFDEPVFDELEVGIWGRPVSRAQPVKAGDRVEIYRPLELDPRTARRELALDGRTMRDGKSD